MQSAETQKFTRDAHQNRPTAPRYRKLRCYQNTQLRKENSLFPGTGAGHSLFLGLHPNGKMLLHLRSNRFTEAAEVHSNDDGVNRHMLTPFWRLVSTIVNNSRLSPIPVQLKHTYAHTCTIVHNVHTVAHSVKAFDCLSPSVVHLTF